MHGCNCKSVLDRHKSLHVCCYRSVLSMFIRLWILDAYTSMKLRCTYMPMKHVCWYVFEADTHQYTSKTYQRICL